jgi:RNA polymerase sigma factor (sigma-70 family)
MDPSLSPDPTPPSHGWEVVSGEVLDLVKRSQAGDKRAFADLQRRYSAPILKFVRIRVVPPVDVEDLSMEIFVTLFHRLPALSQPERFVSFLFGIARKLCNRRLFFWQRRRVAEVSWHDWADTEAGGAIPAALTVPGADEVFWRRETQRELVDAISRLPALERESLMLRYQEGFSYDQISQILDVPMETARYRVRQARRRLATMLPPDDEA